MPVQHTEHVDFDFPFDTFLDFGIFGYFYVSRLLGWDVRWRVIFEHKSICFSHCLHMVIGLLELFIFCYFILYNLSSVH